MQPIVGALLALAPLEALPRTPGRQPGTEQLVLLVKDAEGYANLLRLMSRAYAGAEPGGGDPGRARRAGRATAPG